jgi:hypothetical protein
MGKQCLEFALPNPGEICKQLAGAYSSNSHTCAKTSREIIAIGVNLLRRLVSEKFSIIHPL